MSEQASEDRVEEPTTEHRPWRRRRWIALVLLALVAIALLPPVRVRLAAGAALADAIGIDVPRPFAADVSRSEVTLGGVVGDLYDPGGTAPGIVFLPGATPQGRDDSRAIRAAESIAATGRLVFVPELTLFEQRFDEDDLDRIVDATVALDEHARTEGDVVLLGFSFGGSFAMVAAADPLLEGRLAQVATFGAYFDLVGLLQAATTGVSLVDGEAIEWEPDPQAPGILQDVAVDLAPPAQRRALRAAFDGRRDPESLPDAARSLHAVFANDDPARTPRLVQRLPRDVRERIERFSPSSVIDEIHAPLVAMHSTDDPAVPHAELLRLRAAHPEGRYMTVRLFRHVDFEPPSPRELIGMPRDVLGAWRFASWVLMSQH